MQQLMHRSDKTDGHKPLEQMDIPFELERCEQHLAVTAAARRRFQTGRGCASSAGRQRGEAGAARDKETDKTRSQARHCSAR